MTEFVIDVNIAVFVYLIEENLKDQVGIDD